MTVSKQLIQNIEELRKTLNEVSVYDLNVYTSMELYYNIAKKLNEVINELMRFEGVVSDEVIKQNEVLTELLNDGVITEVVNKINQMVKDGTLDTIINHNVFNSFNHKVWSMANMGEDVKQAMTGGSVAVVGDNTVIESNIVRGQVTPLKTSFFVEGKNLFNKKKSKTGYYVNYQNGRLEENAQYCVSDYILVYPNTKYTMATDSGLRIAFYNLSKEFISGLNTGVQTITTPSNCYYIRYSFYKSSLNTQQFELGEKATQYVDFVKPSFDLTNILNNSLNGVKLEDNSVNAKKLSIINHDINLFDGNYSNYKITGANGSLKLVTGDDNCKTAIIKIKPNTKYSIIREVPSRFNYGTSTYLLEPNDLLNGGINVNSSGNGETSSNPYVTFTTGENDQYLYINTTVDGKNILLQVVEGEQTKFTINDYSKHLRNVNVYSKQEINKLFSDNGIMQIKVKKKGNNIEIYVPSKSSSNYIKYVYNKVVDTSINMNQWRVTKTYLVDSNLNVIYDFDNQTEWEGAIKETGTSDYVGGFHGDETNTFLHILIDGKEYNINNDFEVDVKNEIRIVNKSILNRCDTPNDNILERIKVSVWNKDNYIIENKYKALQQFEISESKVCLMSMRYTNVSDNKEIISYGRYDHDYKTTNISEPFSDVGCAIPRKDVKKIELWGKNSGIYASVECDYNFEKYPNRKQYVTDFRSQNRAKAYFDLTGTYTINQGEELKCKSIFTIKG